MSTIVEAEKAVKFNVFYAKKNVVDSIWKEAIIEGVNITYPQAKVIVEHNQTVEGLTVTGTITVYNLKLAWNYLFEHLNSLVDFEFVAKINSILGASLVHNAGCIRNVPVGISGTARQPEMPDLDTAKAAIEKIANMEPGRERALKMFGYLCRSQLFSDGNKRTAQLIANKMLIADGCGILAIPREQINNFETLLLDFYETNKPDKFFSFLTKEAIYGLDRTMPSSQNLKVKCKAATLGSNALKTRNNTVGISKTQNADRTAHTEHIE